MKALLTFAFIACAAGAVAYHQHTVQGYDATITQLQNDAEGLRQDNADWQEYALDRQAEIAELLADPVSPDPMSATVKLSIPSGGHGSGTHIGGGLIVTAGHVAVKEGDTFDVRFEDGTETKAVTLWSSRTYDIALVRIDETDKPASNLECRTPRSGEPLRFLGNPLGMEWVTTSGYAAGPVTHAYPEAWDTVLPVDAAMAGGMSGGGAFDADGDLVGVNVGMPIQPLGYSGTATGISFVVPGEVVCGLLART